MIAKFNNVEDAEIYEASVHFYLQSFNTEKNPNKYKAARWSNVHKIESFFYVPIHPNIEVQLPHEIVTRIPYIEEEFI